MTPVPFFAAPSPAAQKLEALRQLFPQAVEVDDKGRIRVNTAAIQLALDPGNPAGLRVEEDGYELRWVGKREAYHQAFVPTSKILSAAHDQSKDWDSTGNLLIKGDNLDALKLLRQSYFGKVKLIYIDPPYNTQSEQFIYRDDFSTNQTEVLAQLGYNPENIDYIKNIYGARTHSGWLSFMYPRLLLARDLLRDDGVIFISIDDNEQAQLKLLCDEVFGESNFIVTLVWKSKSGGANDSEHFAVDHEYLHCYSKVKSALSLHLDNEATITTSYNRADALGKYSLERLDKQSIRYSKSGDFEIEGPNNKIYTPKHKDPSQPNATWRWSAKKVETNFSALVFENGNVYTKNYQSDGAIARSLLTEERFGRTRTGKTDLAELINGNVFNSPKPEKLIAFLNKVAGDKNGVTLDFFAGSGTTAEAVMRLNAEDGGNRQFILVQIPQPIDAAKQKEAHHFVTHTLGRPEATIFEITAERIRRAGAKLQAELAAKRQTQGELLDGNTPLLDTGFRVFELVDDPLGLVHGRLLHAATQDHVQELQTLIATPQPADMQRVLSNLLLAEGLPLTTPIHTEVAEHLFVAADVALLLQALPLQELQRILLAPQAAGTPLRYLSVYAPWVQDDNLLLGLETLMDKLGLGKDKLRLRG